MKNIFNKISSFLMAILVLFSTLSFTISNHYCEDTLVSTAIFTKAESCSMDMHNTDEGLSTLISDCCDDEQINLEGQDELNISYYTLTYDQQVFVTSFIYSYINLFQGLEENIIPFRDYSPPLITKDIQLLDEVYLI